MNKIIFSKYSNERARRFAMRTDITQDEHKQRYVQKRAMYPQGEEHIANIAGWYRQLGWRYEGTKIDLNRCVTAESGIVLQYLEGVTLEHVLDSYLLEGNITQLRDVLFEYLAEVKKGFTMEEFHPTPGFREVFGETQLPTGLLCADVADIDMVLNNVLVNQGWTLIDYEWTFAFPIPYDFVVWRILNYYLKGSTTRNCLQELNLYEQAGLEEGAMAVYEEMERHFQEVYVVSEDKEDHCHVPIRDLYDAISPGTVDLKILSLDDRSKRASRMVQLYQADALNFTEERSVVQELEEEGVFLNSFSVDPGVSYVRLDPCAGYCVVHKLQMQWGENINRYQTNGIALEDGSLFFPVEDPQIIVSRPQGGMGDFRVYFEISYMTQEEAFDKLQNLYGLQRRELQEQTEKLHSREILIQDMENTKVWKAYKKYKHTFSK